MIPDWFPMEGLFVAGTDTGVGKTHVTCTLARALRAACARTFNRISVDGDTSTNDTVLLLASGAAGARIASAGGRPPVHPAPAPRWGAEEGCGWWKCRRPR